MSKAVCCIAVSESQAEDIVNELCGAGVASADISILFPDTAGSHDFAHVKRTKMPEGALLGACLGGLAGLSAGLVLHVAALSAAAIGAFFAGVLGALLGARVPEYEARRYDRKLGEGNFLISVHTRGRDERGRVKDIFREAGARHISEAWEAKKAA